MINSQELAIKIKTIAKSKKIAIGKMLTECGLSINTLSSMQSGGYSPRLDTITKIADYLDISVDYLLGRTDEALPGTKKQAAETGSLSNEDITEQVISLFRQMNARERREFLSLALHEFDEQLQEEASHDPGKSDP